MSGIFISYRRTDSGETTGRVYDRLVSYFGPDIIFRDIQSIPFGVDFRDHIDTELNACKVLVAVIGPNWLNAQDAEGNRRLDHPNDWVRLEIETALKRSIPVIPLLVRNATLPKAKDLPDCLQSLAYRNSTTARSDPDFHSDMNRLIAGLKKHLVVQSPTISINSPVPNNIPPPKTICFVDREQPFEKVHMLLEQYRLAVITSNNSVGGTGKTELAIQYSFKHRQDYRGGICWLFPKQSDIGPQITEFVRVHFSRVLTLPKDLTLQTQVLFCWNNWPEENTLLVIDDLVDYNTIQKYLPLNNNRFKILITTRKRVHLNFAIGIITHMVYPVLSGCLL